MKMAKASTADMEMAMRLCSALEAIDRRFFPEGAEGENDKEDFDCDDDAHCGQVLRHVLEILQGGSIARVIWGMDVMLDPANKVVDPDADSLEYHPETVAAFLDSERMDWLADPANGIGNVQLPTAIVTANVHSLRDAIDAAMALPQNAEVTDRPLAGPVKMTGTIIAAGPLDIPFSRECPGCGSTDTEWHCTHTTQSGVVDGRLRMHDVSTVFYLGCNCCSETVRTVSGDDVARWMTLTANVGNKGCE